MSLKRLVPIALLLLQGCSWVTSSNDADDTATVGDLRSQGAWPAVPPLQTAVSRQAAMEQYERFLEDARDPELVPEAMRRLADLHLQQEQDSLVLGTMADVDPAASASRAAELYQQLLTKYPDHIRNEGALYQMARALDQHADAEPAMAALSSYAEQYRGTDRYDEVQFRRGEFLFVQRRYAEAEAAYQEVLQQGADSQFYQQALYKMGWSRFKQQDYPGALDAYVQLFDATLAGHDRSTQPENLPRIDQDRIEDTLRAVSLSFVYLGENDEISRYFATRGARSYEPMLYANLAGMHLQKERFSDAADVYGLFATSHPDHLEAPLFQSRVIDVYKQAGFHQQVLTEKQAFVQRYEPAAAYWQRHDPAASPEVLDQVQRHLRDIARHYHAAAQKGKNPAAYAEASRWYELYLKSFRTSEQAPLMNFLYAELLTTGGFHGKAAAQYEHTAYDYPAHDKSAEAGYAALLAYERHEAALQDGDKAVWHRQGIASALRFANDFSTHPQAMPVRTRAAQQLFALHEYAAAIEAAAVVIAREDAGADLHLAAWTVVAHAQFEGGDYEQAEAAYQQVLKRTSGTGKDRLALEEKLAACIYKQGEQARAAGALEEAAGHFLRIASVVPHSSFNVTAQYDAAAAYIQLQQWPAAIQVLEAWRTRYPQHELQAEVTRKLAVLYNENQQPLQAAAEFERMAASEPDPQLRREAAWSAASLYQQAQQSPQAIAAYQRYVQTYPQPREEAMEARQQLVLLHEASRDRQGQRHWQQQIVQADRAAGTQRSERSIFLAAHARLALVAEEQNAYAQVALQEPLQKNLARKKKYMQATIEGYTEAAAYGVLDVSTQASYRLADLYADFGRALMASERPRGLSGEELEQYDILLEEQAYPFEEKAIAVHETNAERTGDGVYDEWVQKSLTQLASLLPARFAKSERSERFVSP